MFHKVQRLFIFRAQFSTRPIVRAAIRLSLRPSKRLSRRLLLSAVRVWVCYIGIFFNFVCYSQTSIPENADKTTQVQSAEMINQNQTKLPRQKESMEDLFIRHNKEISEWFDSQAEGLDLFLAGQKLTSKKNETTFRIENTSYIKERQGYNNVTGFRMILRLPNLEKYWQLQLTSYDEVQDKRGAKNNYLNSGPREKNYGATIGWFQNLGKVRTAFQPRIELQDPLKVSHSFTFESVIDLVFIHINPKLELFAHPDKGVGIFNAYNFDFPIDNYFSLTWINEGEYQEKTHKLKVSHGLSLGHHISVKRSLSYNIFYDFNNRPDYHMAGYNVSVSWSENIYRKILDYRVTPYLEFTQENGFAGVPGLNFHIYLTY